MTAVWREAWGFCRLLARAGKVEGRHSSGIALQLARVLVTQGTVPHPTRTMSGAGAAPRAHRRADTG